MNSTELSTFLTVAEQRSISAAARLLHVSQPAVSKRIRQLETRLDCRLFDRVGKQMTMTQAGQTLKPQAERLMSLWSDTTRELHNLSAAVTGTLQLATSHHIGLHRLAPVLAEFRANYPNVQMNISFEDSEVTHTLVREGRIDVAVATLDPEALDPALQTRRVWDDPLAFVHPEITQTSLAQLSTLPCVLPGMATYTGRIVANCFSTAQLALQPAMQTNYLETIQMLVGVGMGWSVLPVTMCADLNVVQVQDAAGQSVRLARELGVITHPQRVLSNAANAFLSTLDRYADPV